MKNLLLILVSVFIFAGCSTVKVETKTNKAADFSNYRTYAWLLDEDTPSDDIRVNNPFVARSVRKSVEQNIEKRGYAKASKSDADLLLVWHGGIDKKIKTEDLSHFYNPYGYGPLYREPVLNNGSQQPKVEFEQSTIVIDAIGTDIKKLVWRGSGKEKVEQGMAEQEVEAYIEQSVSQILRNFPSAGN